MYGIFKEYKLEHNSNYQQYFSKNRRFRSYLNLIVNTDKVIFFQKFLEIENEPYVDNLRQDIMYMIFNMLNVTSQNNTNKSVFEKDILNMMQQGKGSLLDVIFIKNMKRMHSNNYNNKCCRMIILNVMKNMFLENILHDVIKKYQQTVLKIFPQGNLRTTIDASSPESFNNTDINRLFSWAMLKLKKRSKKFKDTSVHYLVVLGKL